MTPLKVEKSYAQSDPSLSTFVSKNLNYFPTTYFFYKMFQNVMKHVETHTKISPNFFPTDFIFVIVQNVKT